MQYNEIKGIAKSISRYCWKKDAYHYQEFIDRQTRKGRLVELKVIPLMVVWHEQNCLKKKEAGTRVKKVRCEKY
jgi:hypothetical protein